MMRQSFFMQLVAFFKRLTTMAPEARAFLWGLVVLLAILVFLVCLAVLKRWLRARREPEESGLSMAKLEALRRGGQITEEEFRRLRFSVLGLGPAGVEKDDLVLSRPGKDDDHKGSSPADAPRGPDAKE